MADMGGGQLPKEGRDRLLENQKDAGDSPMDVDGTLRTATPDPLSDGDEILELLALYEGGATAGSQTTQTAAAGEHLSDPVEESTPTSTSSGRHIQDSTGQNAATPHLGVTKGATRSLSNFTKLGPCEKRSWNSQDSKSLFFCRICQKERPKGTPYIGFLPVGETRSDRWQQVCADVGTAGQGSVSCATRFDQLLVCHGALEAEERQLLQGGVTGASASTPLSSGGLWWS